MYKIIKPLSENTFLAEKDNSIFVLKRINEADAGIFRRLSGVHQQGLAQVFEITVLGNGIYAVSEYVLGLTLREYIAQYGLMNEKTATQFARGLCDALTRLHSLGIIHRDLTPNNIVVTRELMPVIIDYGISRIGKGNKSSDTDTLGTAGYAAPEQFGFLETDARTDIYALGAVIRFCLTGNPCGKITNATDLGKIADKCSAYEPSDRFPDAKHVEEAIRIGFSMSQLPKQTKKRKRAVKILSIVYCAIFIIYLGGYYPFINGFLQQGTVLMMFVAGPALCFNPMFWQDKLTKKIRLNRKIKRVFFALVGVAVFVVGYFTYPISVS